ncbi:MAG: Rab family GTPase [Promethearchaeota archaeon]
MEKTVDIKLVVLGEGGVGKTSIINNFLGKEILSEYLPTIGTITSKKDYTIRENDTLIKVNIWDFGGQRSFNVINPSLFSNVDLAIFVFDLSRPQETLKNIKKEFLKDVSSYSEDFLSVIVGNKLDLFIPTDNFKESLENVLNEHDHFFFMSAKTGENVGDCFELLIYTFLKKAEIIMGDVIQENIGDFFLKQIKRDEKTLRNKILRLKSIDTTLKELKSKIKPEPLGENTKNKENYYEFIQKEISKVSNEKSRTLNQFLPKISEFEKALKLLKKSNIKSVSKITNNLRSLLNMSKKDFEHGLELIQRLDREENELMIIQAKIKKNNPVSRVEEIENLKS